MDFKPEYVRCTWSPELEGKEVCYSDSLDELWQEVVNSKDSRTRCEKGTVDYPFKCGIGNWRFVYYDPFFDLKLAHEQGKVIERFWKSEQEWEEWIDDEFPGDLALYRIKPEEENPVTNRELARWLAQGRGECRLCSMGDVSPYAQMAFRYCDKDDFLPVKGIVLVRKWDDKEWHEPTREYMGLEE